MASYIISTCQHRCKNRHSIPVPKGSNFSGPFSDHVARFAFRLMMMTASREEYRERGFYIPFSECQGRRLVGGYWDKVKKATVTEYSHIFEWNGRYSNFSGNCFPKSVRLRAEFRTGETELYQLKRKPTKPNFDSSGLDTPSRKLVADFEHFWLPEEAPIFTNPWQAFTWEGIRSRCFYASRCEFGRFHSSFTAFKHRKMLQSKLPLSSIDIVACQPLILGGVIRRALGALPDIAKWIFICSTSDLYIYIALLMGRSESDEDRKKTKDELIRCIFERRHKMILMPVYSALESEFPTVAKFLRNRKTEINYQAVACDCQKAESELLIDKAVRALRHTPILTVHDEFIAATKHIPKIQDVIAKIFHEEGLAPRFGVKEFA